MKFGYLQFAPKYGDWKYNFDCADKLLNEATDRKLEGLDFLVLPELAFSGPVSNADARPTIQYETQLWAMNRTKKLQCAISVGYPEMDKASLDYYNSVMIVETTGNILNYRKSLLCPPKEAKNWLYWKDNFGISCCVSERDKTLPCSRGNLESSKIKDFLQTQKLIIHPLNYTHNNDSSLSHSPKIVNQGTLEYWESVFQPTVQGNGKVTAIITNAIVTDGDTMYARRSAILEYQKGRVWCTSLGQQERLLVVDIEDIPTALSAVQGCSEPQGASVVDIEDINIAGQEIKRPPCPEPQGPRFGKREFCLPLMGGKDDAGSYTDFVHTGITLLEKKDKTVKG